MSSLRCCKSKNFSKILSISKTAYPRYMKYYIILKQILCTIYKYNKIYSVPFKITKLIIVHQNLNTLYNRKYF